MPTADVRIRKLQLGPFGTNAYVILCAETGASALVDAPGESPELLEALGDTIPSLVLLTHTHFDHIQALSGVAAALGVPVAVHEHDARGLAVRGVRLLKDGECLEIGKAHIEVLHTPGHTPGSVCFLTGRHLIAGDTLFPNGPGKTSKPADLRTILNSLERRVFVLPDDTAVYPGHGPETTLGRERKAFEQFKSRRHRPGLCGDVLWTEP